MEDVAVEVNVEVDVLLVDVLVYVVDPMDVDTVVRSEEVVDVVVGAHSQICKGQRLPLS